MTNTANKTLLNEMVKAFEEFNHVVEAAKVLDENDFILLMTLPMDEKLFHSAITDLLKFSESNDSKVDMTDSETFFKDMERVLITLSYMTSIGCLPKEVSMQFLYVMAYLDIDQED